MAPVLALWACSGVNLSGLVGPKAGVVAPVLALWACSGVNLSGLADSKAGVVDSERALV